MARVALEDSRSKPKRRLVTMARKDGASSKL
jgi:hypothetical protein